jgi:hypothetical protein
MPGVPVHVQRLAASAFLLAWGRATDGWWGLVRWTYRVRSNGQMAELAFAAWVPASALSKPGWSSGNVELPRIGLSDERGEWPAPPSWTGLYAGVWESGDPPVPAGVTVETGPRWQRRA